MSAAHQTVPVPVAPPEKPYVAPPPPTSGKPSSRKPWIWLVLGLLAIVAVWATMRARTQPEPAETPATTAVIRTVKVAAGSIDRTIRLAGQTSAMDFANIVAPVLRAQDGGRDIVLVRTAKPGSLIKKGQLVAQIDAQAMIDHLDDVGDQVVAAQNDIAKKKAELAVDWENLQQSLRVAKSEVDKARLDFKAASVRTDVEQQLLKLSLDESEARYKQLQNDLQQKQISHASDLKLLEIALEKTVRHRERHEKDVAAFSIYAPMEGLVVMTQLYRNGEMATIQDGDRLNPGQSILKIVNLNKMQVEGMVNQAQSNELRIGLPARLRLDAFKDLSLNGEIYSMGALASASSRQGDYIRNVPVRVRILGADSRLIPDLSASVDVIMETAQGTIVPLSAVRSNGDRTVVRVKEAEGFAEREVKLGLRSNTHAIVLSGVKSGDEVQLN